MATDTAYMQNTQTRVCSTVIKALLPKERLLLQRQQQQQLLAAGGRALQGATTPTGGLQN
jgi:hypothetical protein